MLNDSQTICAPLTPNQPSAVGVIRLSGDKSLEIINKIFKNANRLTPNGVVYGSLKYNGELIDRVLVTYFKAPHSYTGEDIIEISCHGSVAVINRVMEILINSGARMAAPGEFSKRAFLNGKMDLTQAESIMELIDAQTDAEVRSAAAHMGGSTFMEIEQIRSDMLDIASSLGAYIDYPDEEIEELENKDILTTLQAAKENAAQLIKRGKVGAIYKNGINTAILGKTNAGKSSLMNMLSGYQRSIVTDMEGTTRDVIENTVIVNGIKLTLSDTAGLRDTDIEAEQIGIDMSINAAKTASLCLCVFDLSREITEEDYRLERITENARRIGIFNKTDLTQKADVSRLLDKFNKKVFISAKESKGIDELSDIIKEMYMEGLPADSNLIMSSRQYDQLITMDRELTAAIDGLNMGVTLDAVGVCIDGVIAAAGEITGRSVSEDTVHRIFERFCVGK